jgi:hypothetical protein
MLGTAEINALVVQSPPELDLSAELARCGAALRKSFGVAFTIWDAATGELPANWPAPSTAASHSSSPTKTACSWPPCR